MKNAHGKFLGASGHLMFVAAVWTALAIALLCALLPAGLPLTKFIGSAFNPSTTAVALNPGSPRVGVKPVVRRNDNGGPAKDLPLPIDSQSALLTAIASHPAPVPHGQLPTASHRPNLLLSSSPNGAPYPRGPPIV
jgi:hypothetical protein